jgi:hypothetical protein
MTAQELLKKHLSDLGKKGAKARRKKYGKGIYAEMARKRWAKHRQKLSTSKPLASS